MTSAWPELAALGIAGRITCTFAPFQVEGEVEGAYWYFRARHGGVQVGMSSESPDEAVSQTIRGEWALHGEDVLNLGYDADPRDDLTARYVADLVLDCARRRPGGAE